MRLYGGIAIVGCLLFTALAAGALFSQADNLAKARSDAAQLVRIQTIRTNLVSADANLTNAFLVGGLEPTAERSAYTQGISTASKTLAEASGVDAEDALALQGVNDTITTYTGLVEAARANNRQGFPIGAAYLRQATTLLRNDALPVLQRLVLTQQKRVDAAYAASIDDITVLVIGVALGLLSLVVLLFFLSARTRRWINLSVAAAALGVLVVGAVGVLVMNVVQSKANDTRSGAYRETVSLATARTDAFDAKSAESLTLIARGSGQAYDERFDRLAANARSILTSLGTVDGIDVSRPFDEYLTVHRRIRSLDDAGQYDQAVQVATSASLPDTTTANQAFSAFDQASSKALDAQASSLSDDLRSTDGPLKALGYATVLVGLAAATATYRGVLPRLREYR